MANIQEICDDLKTIAKLLSGNHNNTVKGEPSGDRERVDEIVAKVCHLCDNDLTFAEFYSRIGVEVDQMISDETMDHQSRRLWRLIDAMIRAIVLLNRLSPEELVTNQNFMTIKLTTIRLISVTIIPYVCPHFQRIQDLFLTNETNCLSQTDKQVISRQTAHNFTTFFIQLLNSKSLISRILLDDCFASLMAALMTVRHESGESDQQIRDQIDRQLSSIVDDFDETIVIRNLLLLSRCRATKWSNNEISKCLSRCLIRNSGLLSLITAVIDCDQTSQQKTTLHQRYQAIGTIVAAMPALCCSLRQYFETIGRQVMHLMLSTDLNHHTIGSIILQCLENRNQKLTQELIITKILNLFQTPNATIDSVLCLNTGIEIISNLIVCRYDIKKFVPIVSHLFYCRVVLEESLSHYKTLLNNIIIQIFSSIKQSVYLMDNILFNNYKLINRYTICVNDDVIGLKHKQSMNCNDLANNEELSLKQIDSLVQFVLQMLNKLSESFKIDLFLLLIERMTFNKPSLLTCALVDSIHDSVSQILSNFPEKSIKFVINTFERLAEQPIEGSVSDENNAEDVDETNADLVDTRQNSLTMCLQIVKIVLKEKDKLKSEDVNQLKQLTPSLTSLLNNQSIDESLRNTAKDMRNQIEIYGNTVGLVTSDDKLNNEFEVAMTELNDPLMPARAHALIKLKQLIYAKDKQLLDNKSQLINALKMCLNDSESYIYLSAVNTLSVLAIQCTDDVLPVLTAEFGDNERQLDERCRVGEVLVRLSKSMGDFGHHYSRLYISCFLNGVKSTEPAIRVSSLSNLGQFCGSLRFALKPYIVEIMSCVEAVLKTDPSMEVKRSAVMLLCLLLRSLDRDTIEAIDQQIKMIYRLLRHIYSTTIDDILQLHTQLAIDEIDRIVKDMFTPNTSLVKNIQILSL